MDLCRGCRRGRVRRTDCGVCVWTEDFACRYRLLLRCPLYRAPSMGFRVLQNGARKMETMKKILKWTLAILLVVGMIAALQKTWKYHYLHARYSDVWRRF